MTVIRKDSSCVTTWQTSEYVSTCDQIYTRLNISTRCVVRPTHITYDSWTEVHPHLVCCFLFYLFYMFYSSRYTLFDWNLVFCSRVILHFLLVGIRMRSSILSFGTLASRHRHNRGFFHSLVTGLTILGLVIDALTRRRPLSPPPLETRRRLWGNEWYNELLRMGGRKRTTGVLYSKCVHMNDNGGGRCYPLREVRYIESAVCVLSTHSVFGWTTNFSLLLAAVG